MTEFTVPGRPATKGSTVSFLGDQGRVVTKTDSVGLRAWTRDVGWSARAARVPLAQRDVPVCLRVVFHYARPTRARRAWPTVPPDIDKTVRALLDALTGVAYEDDAQVVELSATKVYATSAKTVVVVGDVPTREESSHGHR